MNAVKRCLALIAATLVVGACGGDPTVDDAGTNLSIRATPGAVWVRNNSSATVTIEAVDPLGGPATGSWSVGPVVGPMTAVLDSNYQNTSAGALGLKSRFVVTPITEGEGNVTFTGTGGSVLVPVRIAPDTNAFAVAISDLTPTIGDTLTITAPAGTRFTALTTVNFYNGSLTRNLQQGAVPMITSIDAPDSTVLHVIPPAGAEGQLRITGISNPSTPSLTVTARSADAIAVVDTKTLTATYSLGTSGIAPNTAMTITLTQPGYRFRTGAGAAADTSNITAPFPGSSMAGVKTVISDSLNMTVFLPPGYRNPVGFTKLFNAAQPYYNLALPGIDSIRVDSLPQAGLGQDDPNVGPVGTITLPAMNPGDRYVFWDNGTLSAPDFVAIGQHDNDQFVAINITTAGRYEFSVAWDGTASAPDIDNYIMNSTLTGFRATCGSCGANPEVLTTSATTPLAAGSTQYWAATLWDGQKPTRFRVTVRRVS